MDVPQDAKDLEPLPFLYFYAVAKKLLKSSMFVTLAQFFLNILVGIP